MQADTLRTGPIFTAAGESLLLGVFLAAAAATVLLALWLRRRRRR